jgi:hypothetical protein
MGTKVHEHEAAVQAVAGGASVVGEHGNRRILIVVVVH